MLFGKQETATVLGKTLTGYADGSGDAEQKSRPMARFLLDEPSDDGSTSLTLTLDKALYARLLVGSHGSVSHLGSRCLGFTPDGEETEDPPVSPAAHETQASRESDYTPPPIGEWNGAQPASPPTGKVQMTCPWCGQPLSRWFLSSRDALVLKRETEEPFSLKTWWRDREKNRIALEAGGFLDELLVHVCENCKKAVIDIAPAASGGENPPPSPESAEDEDS